MDYIMPGQYLSHSFVRTFHFKDGSVAVIEDSILEVLKQANKPRVYFLNVLTKFCIISIYKLISWNYFHFCHTTILYLRSALTI